jgi:Asp-tRNA(Asn)/Glu-tRNA(Gln) amidotransferase A subunit family amidase
MTDPFVTRFDPPTGGGDGSLSGMRLAGHAGPPQVTVPARDASGLPAGLSLIGPRRSDRSPVRLDCDLAPPRAKRSGTA